MEQEIELREFERERRAIIAAIGMEQPLSISAHIEDDTQQGGQKEN
ncbi:uncharacterized protein G2W53_003959 [Senna tora]|uniref:Uncharacterized protein n=1 Tax=Senna tora TaxID=362788 RepID=A0A835CG78_9FABA|nr:uncharacterized protein G2W53_003959 [Senna tora]